MPDKKLTDSEIVKALEDCPKNVRNRNCKSCLYTTAEKFCLDRLMEDTLNLINRLQAKNEELVGNIDKLKKFKAYFDDLYGCDLEVLGWHENGDAISFDEFYDSAMNETESIKRKECKGCLHYSACKGTYYTAKGGDGLLYDFDGEMYADSGCEDYKKVAEDENNG